MKNFTVYKSSAGSGKTFTLVKEYLRIALMDPNPNPTVYKGILAVTFTNKAATEMKERVIKTLQKISDSNTPEPMMGLLEIELILTKEQIAIKAKALLNAILHNYTEFAIGTIDSFVHRIVRTFAIDLKLPLNFSIETDKNKILALCVNQLTALVGEDKLITDVLLEFTKTRMEENRSWNVEEEMVRFVKNVLDENGADHLDKIKNFSTTDLIEIKNLLKEFIDNYTNTLKVLATQCLDFCNKNNLQASDFYYTNSGIYNYFKKLSEEEIDFEMPNSNVRKTIENDKWKGAKSNLNETQIDFLKDKLNQIENFRTKDFAKFFTYKALFKNIYSLIIVNEIEKLVQQYKEEENIVFISEFNKKIASIINEEPVPFIYERLGEKFKHFLLDEFQDTSLMQWQNLLPLVDNSLANANYNLVVGDGKQSIYRWRGAEVEQFTMLPQLLANNNPFNSEREKTLVRNFNEKVLAYNFRSKKNIIDFNNIFFSWLKEIILPPKFLKVYDNHEQISFSTSEAGYVSFDVIPKKEEKETKDEEVCKKTLAHIYNNTKNLGYPLSDITVLVRTKNDGKKIADYLVANNIPIVSSEALLIAGNESVRTLISVLTLVNNFRSNTQETQVLNYLVSHGFFQKQNLSSVLNEFYESRKNLGDWLFQNKIADVRRSKLGGLPLYDTCSVILRELKMVDKDPLFIRFFLDAVLKYSASYRENLKGFLDWWELEANNVSAILPMGTNAVNIMTIHAAKGLEFPVVIMPFADWDNKKPNEVWVELNEPALPNLQTALVSSGSQLKGTPYMAFAEAEDAKQILDNVNLLYVATTRAINHLHIISRDRGKSNYCDAWLRNFFKTHFNADDNRVFYEFGNLIGKQELNPQVIEQINMDLKLRDWKEIVQIKFSSDAFPEISLKNEKRNYGILFHLAMSKVFEKGDEIKAADILAKNGHCNQEKATEISNKIKQLFALPKFSEFFLKENFSLNEPEIVNSLGKTIRPDRVVFHPNHVSIIDYKTGVEMEGYEVQLTTYQNQLIALGHKCVKKFIIYVEEEKVEELV